MVNRGPQFNQQNYQADRTPASVCLAVSSTVTEACLTCLGTISRALPGIQQVIRGSMFKHLVPQGIRSLNILPGPGYGGVRAENG